MFFTMFTIVYDYLDMKIMEVAVWLHAETRINQRVSFLPLILLKGPAEGTHWLSHSMQSNDKSLSSEPT